MSAVFSSAFAHGSRSALRAGGDVFLTNNRSFLIQSRPFGLRRPGRAGLPAIFFGNDSRARAFSAVGAGDCPREAVCNSPCRPNVIRTLGPGLDGYHLRGQGNFCSIAPKADRFEGPTRDIPCSARLSTVLPGEALGGDGVPLETYVGRTKPA